MHREWAPPWEYEKITVSEALARTAGKYPEKTALMNNPLYTDTELEHQLNDSESTVLVTLDLLAPR